MTNIETGTPKFAGKIIRVAGEQRAALSVSIVICLTQRIVSAERELRIQSAVETYENLRLSIFAGGFRPAISAAVGRKSQNAQT